MRKISGYIISVLLLLPLWCGAQEPDTPAFGTQYADSQTTTNEEVEVEEIDTTRFPINAMKGVRVGVDLSRFALPLLHKGQRGFEACADMHIKGNLFATAEGGWFGMDITNDTAYHYKLNGFYGKIGVDYNMLKQRRAGSNDIFYIGLRYAISRFSHQADNVTVGAPYWPDASGLSIPSTSMTSHWLELLAGIKCEVVKNFYVGATFRVRFRLKLSGDQYSSPAQIPGYGIGLNKFTYGINYYVAYNIHF